MTQSAGGIVRDWFEQVWNNRRLDLADRHLAPDALVHGLDETGAPATGPAGFKPFFDRMHATFSDIRFELHDVIESGSMAAGRWTATMTHTGGGLGVAATHRPVTFTGMAMARVENGQIVEAWNEWDKLTVMAAVGLVTAAIPAVRQG